MSKNGLEWNFNLKIKVILLLVYYLVIKIMWGYEMKWINIIVIVIGNIVEIMNVRIGFIFDIKLFGCVKLMLKNYFLGYWKWMSC